MNRIPDDSFQRTVELVAVWDRQANSIPPSMDAELDAFREMNQTFIVGALMLLGVVFDESERERLVAEVERVSGRRLNRSLWFADMEPEKREALIQRVAHAPDWSGPQK
jgi:hypothetical protein